MHENLAIRRHAFGDHTIVKLLRAGAVEGFHGQPVSLALWKTDWFTLRFRPARALENRQHVAAG
jgi:hypothetical protein